MTAKRSKVAPSARLGQLYGGMKFGEEMNVLEEHVMRTGLADTIKTVLGIDLVGPCQVLHSVDKPQTKDLHCWHRYNFDPPECMTVAVRHATKEHWCYFRDDPSETPVMVVHNKASDGGVYGDAGDSILALLVAECKAADRKRDASELRQKLQDLAKKYNIPLTLGKAKRKRKAKVNAPTFSGIGICVPFDEDTEIGYRPLSVSDKKLRSILDAIVKAKRKNQTPDYSQLDLLVQYANISNDEFDFGQALQLGLDLYAHSLIFKTDALHLLAPTYALLQRDVFADILERFTPRRGQGWKEAGELRTLEAAQPEHDGDSEGGDDDDDDDDDDGGG